MSLHKRGLGGTLLVLALVAGGGAATMLGCQEAPFTPVSDDLAKFPLDFARPGDGGSRDGGSGGDGSMAADLGEGADLSVEHDLSHVDGPA